MPGKLARLQPIEQAKVIGQRRRVEISRGGDECLEGGPPAAMQAAQRRDQPEPGPRASTPSTSGVGAHQRSVEIDTNRRIRGQRELSLR